MSTPRSPRRPSPGRIPRWQTLSAVLLFGWALLFAAPGSPGKAPEAGATVVSKKAVTFVESAAALAPAQGHGGGAATDNFWPYFLPGQGCNTGPVFNDPFAVAYAGGHQPVESSDWWTGIGLQWKGWVTADANSGFTNAFYNEPFGHAFLDEPTTNATRLPLPTHGIRFWNQRDMQVVTDTGYNLIRFTRGNLAPAASPIMTVGLKDVHPIRTADLAPPQAAPWTNVTVRNYSDWGVVLGYASNGSELTITLANGSPFTWLERTQGTAPFRVWAGTPIGDDLGSLTIWYNQGGTLGLTVKNTAQDNGKFTNTSAYAVFADAGAWTQTDSSDPMAHTALFANDDASRVVVLAMPHNVDPANAAALIQAMTELKTYAWQRTVNTRLHYPPIPGSDAGVDIGGANLPLGYDAANARLRFVLKTTVDDFATHGPGGTPLQLLFPHQRKNMIDADREHILWRDGQPAYTWRSVKGELVAYAGNRLVQELPVRGILPFLPNVGVDSAAAIAGQVPADDIYATLKTWFYQGEPKPGGQRIPAFVRDLGTYMVYNSNTYSPELAGIFENLLIADQLAQSPRLTGFDADLGKPRAAVAAEIRTAVLDALKELVGRWGDVYTSGFFIYNTTYDTLLPSHDGYGSVQNLNDRHFHYGYFLRSAAIIGRYDRAWLDDHLPLFEELIHEVASVDRNSARYPFLRNFSPFYGHSWANGTGNNGDGNDQESTSEAVNFAAGLFDLGQVLGRADWRDLGLYLYEQEIQGAEQYWFNQDADLDHSSGTFYNGNWPDAFVHYQKAGTGHITPFIGQVYQSKVTRETYFGSAAFPAFSNSLLIHAIPLSASSLYLGRNPRWLAKAWEEYQRENAEDPRPSAYEVIVAGLQAQLPGAEPDASKPGPIAALARIRQDHEIFPPAMNSQGKHWAYTLACLGSLDASVHADVPAYGAFQLDGARTLVAYNPGASPLTATFKDAAGQVVGTLQVPAYSIAAGPGGGSPATFRPALSAPPGTRLYLRTAAASKTDPAAMALSARPGAWLPAEESYAYPANFNKLDPSLVVVPKRSDPGAGATTPPANPAEIRTWKGQVSGRLGSDAMTRFALYTDHSLFPGWERNPACAGNTFTFRVSYDFDSDGVPERIENYPNAALSVGNTFSYENRPTEYATNLIWPYPAPLVVMLLDAAASAPFPAEIPSDRPATVTLEIWGGSNTHPAVLHDVPVSAEASPSLGRASWIQTPYSETAAAEPLICPHVAGTGDWRTHLYLVNPGDSAVTPRLAAYSAQGALLQQVTLPAIPAKGSWNQDLGAVLSSQTLAAYPWIRIQSDGPLKGMENITTADGLGEALTPLGAPVATSLLVPAVFYFPWPGGMYTGVALANPNGQAAHASLQAYDYLGGKIGAARSVTIPAMGNTAQLIQDLFPTPQYDPMAIRSVAATSDLPLAGMELFGYEGDPAVEGLALVQQFRQSTGYHALYFPHVPSRSTYDTLLSFLNAGSDKTSVSAFLINGTDGNNALAKPWIDIAPMDDVEDDIYYVCGGNETTSFPFEVYGRLSSDRMPICGVEFLFAKNSDDEDDFEATLGIGSGTSRLVFPAVAQPGWSAALRLLALGSKAGVPYTVTAYAADGTEIGRVTGNLTVGANNARPLKKHELATEIPGWSQAAWVLVTADGLVAGELFMASPDGRRFEGYAGLQ